MQQYQNLLYHVYIKLDMSPETRQALYEHGIINSDTLLHLVGYFCMNTLKADYNVNLRWLFQW
jgi:hypothetical protein